MWYLVFIIYYSSLRIASNLYLSRILPTMAEAKAVGLDALAEIAEQQLTQGSVSGSKRKRTYASSSDQVSFSS